jgi:hypothetical protein
MSKPSLYAGVNGTARLITAPQISSGWNIADNSDFSINQSYPGSVEGTEASYVVDRWIKLGGTTSSLVKYNELGYISIVGATCFRQPIEYEPVIKRLRGQHPICVSMYARVNSGTFSTCITCYPASISISHVPKAGQSVAIGEWKLYTSVYGVIPDGTSSSYIEINTATNTDIDIKWINVNVGYQPSVYAPEEPIQALNRCRRFRQLVGGHGLPGFTVYSSDSGGGCGIILNYKASPPMRINPSMLFPTGTIQIGLQVNGGEASPLLTVITSHTTRVSIAPYPYNDNMVLTILVEPWTRTNGTVVPEQPNIWSIDETKIILDASI